MQDDHEGINELFERFSRSWKANDSGAVGDCFVDDGSLINPFGERADGRGAVAAMYAEYFSGMLQGTTTTVDGVRLRALDAGLAFVDAEQTVRDGSGEVVLTVHLAALLRGDGDEWRFVDARPYTVAPSPA